ncbi:MAG: CTP synthase, partial [Simkaniaceae bacterium]|nr:CTP synthase [Simkaniaceae bacterium]
MNQKFIFVTGGVVSSLGKGITAASIASLLESRGLKIALLKLDPYVNVDPGTMNPFEHGEVYVTADGCETDLDLGHYYRFTNSPLSKHSNATAGQVYNTVTLKERRGDFLGSTVQVIPHITNEIKQRIINAALQEKGIDITIVEIGGTVGDIESLPFLEAIRQFENENRGDCLTIHLTYVPHLKAAGEVKTKPTQHSVQALRAIGIIPDFIVCRSENPLSNEIKEKISLFCSVPKDAVIDEPDASLSIYEIPINLHKSAIDEKICAQLGLSTKKSSTAKWEKILTRLKNPSKKITIGIVGKYTKHQDAYKSIVEALIAAGIANQVEVEVKVYDAEKPNAVNGCDGYLIPGGFGERGFAGKVQIAKRCRENKIPYFGICLGMQVMV